MFQTGLLQRQNKRDKIRSKNKMSEKNRKSFSFGMSSLPLSAPCGFYKIKKKRTVLGIKHVLL